MELFHPDNCKLTKYLFFTGKGGVGKTSIACATAVSLADSGKKVLLISTDPASNLQDVFARDLTNKETPIPEVPNLSVANLDPLQAAAAYRESVIAPYRGKLPQAVIAHMEEQLSGSCTIEIAAFHEFSSLITDEKLQAEYTHIVFDTAPTGHTLRMLQLPSAWSSFISESTHGASCLGQLSGLESKKAMYQQAVETLADGALTTVLLVTRPETAPIKEAERAAGELAALGVCHQRLLVNGVLVEPDDAASQTLFEKQQAALGALPERLRALPLRMVPLRAYSVTGIETVRALLTRDPVSVRTEQRSATHIPALSAVIDELAEQGKRVIFTMGKGGVGKTTLAAAIALGLAKRGKKVHLTTTDPAAHVQFVLDEGHGVTLSHIDEAEELKKYQSEVLATARASGMSEGDIAYVEEDLRSPCTQEIAVFRAFAELVEQANEQIVVIDTAPTGHTLLLLESTQSYHHEMQRSKGDIPEAVTKLLPRLKSAETEVIIVTLPEATPVYEALRLEADLLRAGIATTWWLVNQSLYKTHTTNPVLAAKAGAEVAWLNKVDAHTKGHFALIGWRTDEIKGGKLLTL